MNEEISDANAHADLIEATAVIVSAFASSNSLPAGEMPGFIAAVHGALATTRKSKVEASLEPMLNPAVPIEKSVTSDYIICLDDGLKFKSMRRHLAILNMTPDEYRTKWGLPRDYPMVAPGYAATRSALARKAGLGRKVETEDAVVVEVKKSEPRAPAKRGRPRNAV